MDSCPSCQSQSFVKNGHIHNGKQRYRFKDCQRPFVEDPQNALISEETQALIDRLLLEKIPLAGIARAVQVSESWLQSDVNQKYQDTIPGHPKTDLYPQPAPGLYSARIYLEDLPIG